MNRLSWYRTQPETRLAAELDPHSGRLTYYDLFGEEHEARGDEAADVAAWLGTMGVLSLRDAACIIDILKEKVA